LSFSQSDDLRILLSEDKVSIFDKKYDDRSNPFVSESKPYVRFLLTSDSVLTAFFVSNQDHFKDGLLMRSAIKRVHFDIWNSESSSLMAKYSSSNTGNYPGSLDAFYLYNVDYLLKRSGDYIEMYCR
jgi:hypothetical protein